MLAAIGFCNWKILSAVAAGKITAVVVGTIGSLHLPQADRCFDI